MVTKKKLGFIGVGNMGEALVKGLIASKAAAPAQILVSARRRMPGLEAMTWSSAVMADPPVKVGSFQVLFAKFTAAGGIARPTTVMRTCRTEVGVEFTDTGSDVTVPVPAV